MNIDDDIFQVFFLSVTVIPKKIVIDYFHTRP